MGLEFDLSESLKGNKTILIKELRAELSPRNQCRGYVAKNRGKAILVTREEFDSYLGNNDFLEGPFKDSFGDGYGEPYNPDRQAFGKLKSDLVVYCELSKEYQEKYLKLLELCDEK